MLDAVIEHIVKYWAGWACGIFSGLIVYLFGRVKRIRKENIGMHNGLLALLRDRINQSCSYHLSRKCISAIDREVLNNMFDSYFDMGGNGAVKHLKVEIDQLPTVFDEIH